MFDLLTQFYHKISFYLKNLQFFPDASKSKNMAKLYQSKDSTKDYGKMEQRAREEQCSPKVQEYAYQELNIETTLSILFSNINRSSCLSTSFLARSTCSQAYAFSTYSYILSTAFRKKQESDMFELLLYANFFEKLETDLVFEDELGVTLAVEFGRVDLVVSFRGEAGTSVMTHLGMYLFIYLWKQQLQKTTYNFSCSTSISHSIALEAGLTTLSTIFLQMTCRSAPIVMLKSTAHPYSARQYRPKVQITSVKQVPMVSKFINWQTLTSRSAGVCPQQPLILDTARFCRKSLQGTISFFSRINSTSPLAVHSSLPSKSDITLSHLIFSTRRRLIRIKILKVWGRV